MVPAPMPGSVKVDSDKGSHTGAHAQVAPSQRWGQVPSVVPGLHPARGAESHCLLPASGLVNETQDTSSGNSQKPPEWTQPVLAGDASQRGSAVNATVFLSSDSEHPSQAVNS